MWTLSRDAIDPLPILGHCDTGCDQHGQGVPQGTQGECVSFEGGLGFVPYFLCPLLGFKSLQLFPHGECVFLESLIDNRRLTTVTFMWP